MYCDVVNVQPVLFFCQLDGRFSKLCFEITILFFIKACSASPGWSLKHITSIAFYCFAVVVFFCSRSSSPSSSYAFAVGLHRITFELLTSTCEMYDKQMALIVPVLVDITEAEVPPCLRNVRVVDMRRDPNYQHKLMTILKGLWCGGGGVCVYGVCVCMVCVCVWCVCVCVCVRARARAYVCV